MKNTIVLLFFLVSAMSIYAQETPNYKIKNLSVNTEYADFGVAYFGENKVVFASSRKGKGIHNRIWNINNQRYLELHSGTIDELGEINNTEPFSKKINTKYHESNVAFTKDQQTIYFTRNNYLRNKLKKDENGSVLIQLYRAQIGEDGVWSNIEPLPFNSDNYHTGHPVLNADENKLYFTSNMPGSFGKTDIYETTINADGTFGEPKNLGPNVNTPYKEMFPFIDEDDVLYYASDGFAEGKGGLDIYATKISGSKGLVKSVNLGYPINSGRDDFGLTFQSGAKRGHFSSNRSGGKGDDDIYYFEELVVDPLQEELVVDSLKTDCTQLVEGVVRDSETGALLVDALVVLYGDDGVKIESMMTDRYGTFIFKADCENNYTLGGSKRDFSGNSNEFEISLENNKSHTVYLKRDPIEFVKNGDQLMVAINPIYFDLNKTNISIKAAKELEKVVKVMKKYPGLIIELGAHTDSRSRDEYNLDLSNRRAKSTIEWIIDKGISGARIIGKGYGETKLVNRCSNGVRCSESEHQNNRRSEFVIVNPEIIEH